MSQSKLERAGIRLILAADPVWLHAERCWQLGMIVYELVTNAARHALFDGGDGEVLVELTCADGIANCRVSDNGSAPKGVRTGRGLKIIGDLARSSGGQVDHSFGVEGALFTLAFPFTAKEERANRRRRAMCPSVTSAKEAFVMRSYSPEILKRVTDALDETIPQYPSMTGLRRRSHMSENALPWPRQQSNPTMRIYWQPRQPKWPRSRTSEGAKQDAGT